MLLATLANGLQWKPFTQAPILTRSLRWISENADAVAEGIHELGEPGWFVNVHSYTTQDRDSCTWENHPQTIDIQYMIDGTEGIDLVPVETLGEPTAFKPESDTQKFAQTDTPASQLILRTGDFVIFLPGEAHRPKVAVSKPVALRKLVVKIPSTLLSPG
ncbi:MAG: YhcH/YjgK/YiaL family protein [Terrimicrobiaceae bacterium]|jgi:biofilm protein TabA